MKKIIILSFIIIVLCLFGFFNKTKNTISSFIEENNLKVSDFAPYLTYSSFDPLLYFEYEKIRKDSNDYLFAVNTVSHPNFYKPFTDKEKALFTDSIKVLVNKHYYLPSTYTPPDLVKISSLSIDYIVREDEMMVSSYLTSDLIEMIEASKKEGLHLTIFSSFRSYEAQENIYYNIQNQDDSVSARPGHSEHQTGLALDISTRDAGLTEYFEDTLEYLWLRENCYEYGFIERYKDDYKDKTLYSKESWHYRYVGKEISKKIKEENISYEEYVLKYLEF